jgi:hypothetical protein
MPVKAPTQAEAQVSAKEVINGADQKDRKDRKDRIDPKDMTDMTDKTDKKCSPWMSAVVSVAPSQTNLKFFKILKAPLIPKFVAFSLKAPVLKPTAGTSTATLKTSRTLRWKKFTIKILSL